MTNIHKPAASETLIQGGHPTLGLITECHPEYLDTVTLTCCDPAPFFTSKFNDGKAVYMDLLSKWWMTSLSQTSHNLLK
jgi:hypothetical protein